MIQSSSKRTPSVELIEVQPISRPAENYCGWPTVTRLSNGDLVAVYSGSRQQHVCPYGRIHFVRSTDEGRTWSEPVLLTSGPLDDRDAGIVEAANGDLVVVWFTSLAFERELQENLRFAAQLSPEERAEWEAISRSLNDTIRLRELGCWAKISSDGGKTWSQPVATQVNSPHGPIRLKNGTLFYAGKFRAEGRIGERHSPFSLVIGAAISCDHGRTWQRLSEIAPMPGHDGALYGELHAVEAADGRIVVHIRNNREEPKNEILQTESFDGGRTWTEVRSTGLWGFPSHLLKLKDNRLLVSYSHRREPRGNRIAISHDHGQSWSEPLELTGGETCNDFGYPSTVQLDDHTFYTVWYTRQENSRAACIKGARWKLIE